LIAVYDFGSVCVFECESESIRERGRGREREREREYLIAVYDFGRVIPRRREKSLSVSHD